MNQNNYPEKHTLNLNRDSKISLCRCWRSKKFPYCDGSHRKMKEKYDTPMGPVIVYNDHKNT